MKTVIVCWPTVQLLFDEPGFRENSALCSSEPFYSEYGDSSYAVNKEWLEKREQNLLNKVISQQETYAGPDFNFGDELENGIFLL